MLRDWTYLDNNTIHAITLQVYNVLLLELLRPLPVNITSWFLLQKWQNILDAKQCVCTDLYWILMAQSDSTPLTSEKLRMIKCGHRMDG